MGMCLSFGMFMHWVESYPDDYDPKNIDYVLWTHGLNRNMNLDHAIAGMTHDTFPDRLVKGLTKDQLTSRFGYIRQLQDMSPYYQGCPSAGGHPIEKEVVFIRDGPWMAIMDKGKAADLILCKGY